MNYPDLVQLIGSLGFPIVACGALFYMINTTLKELQATLEEVNRALAIITSKIEEV